MTLSISPIAAAVDVFAPLDAATVTSHFSHKSERALYPDQAAVENDNDDDADVEEEEKAFPAAPVYATAAAADNQTSGRKSRKHVRFDEADVLEFEPSAWTATVASDSIPVGMSNTLRRRTRRRLDSFENERCLWRVRREEFMEHGYLEPDERLEILESAGLSPAVLSHVEKETIRINRERWESNEYDLMYQFGLGEVPVMEMSDDEHENEDDDVLFLTTPDSHDDDDCGLMQLDDSDDCGSESNQGDGFYYSARNVLADAEVRFAMEEMDAYDTRRYEELNVDYAVDCILGDDSDSTADENNELPYAKDSFESPLSFPLPEMMSSSPTDVSAASECMIVSCSPLRAAAHASVLATGEPKMFRI
jgi:hypothetical protein